MASGLVSILAGGAMGFADGLGTAASFSGPHGIAMNADGTVALVVSGTWMTTRGCGVHLFKTGAIIYVCSIV